jgi:uncharacterized cofD-like protein
MFEPHKARILVADPKPALSHQLASLIAPYEDQVIWTKSLTAALNHLSQGGIDLVLADEAALGEGWDVLDRLVQGGRRVIVLADDWPLERLVGAYQHGVELVVIKPFHPRELLLGLHAALGRFRRIVCLGGGTGLYTMLLGLKTLPNVLLTSVVTMSDDGGSSGRIREAFGVLPPGDVRRSLVALSTAPDLMNELISYRFRRGEGLKDHNLGNLLLVAMTHLRGSMAEAVRSMGDILGIQGIVLPVTTQMNTLVAQLEDGTEIRGETNIDVPKDRDPEVRIVRLWQEPEPDANPNALSAILAADLVLLGPGDLFTGVVATLAVKGIRDAVAASRGRKLYVCNLMTKPGETSGFGVVDHVREIVRYLGRDALDHVLVANTIFSPLAIARYARNGQFPVRLRHVDEVSGVTAARVLLRDVGSEHELVRHDSMKLAGEVARVLATLGPKLPLVERQHARQSSTV